MSRETRPIVAIVTVVALAILAVMALRSGTTETVVLPRVDLPPPGEIGSSGDPTAIVISVRNEQETSFFGIIRGDTHHMVSVQFYAPAECAAAITQGARWPLPTSECSSGVPIEGSVSGTGISPTGETIVAVDVETTEECFAAVAPGDPWPPTNCECLGGS